MERIRWVEAPWDTIREMTVVALLSLYLGHVFPCVESFVGSSLVYKVTFSKNELFAQNDILNFFNFLTVYRS